MDNADIPVVILCGGMGTRLREASEKLPKPLVDIGGKPILWHIMKLYGEHGFRKFVLCLGYKSDLIKRYFLDYQAEVSDFTLHMGDRHRQEFHNSYGQEDWHVTFADTGLLSGTGARMVTAGRVVPAGDQGGEPRRRQLVGRRRRCLQGHPRRAAARPRKPLRQQRRPPGATPRSPLAG